jgi:hypothetical protein
MNPAPIQYDGPARCPGHFASLEPKTKADEEKVHRVCTG